MQINAKQRESKPYATRTTMQRFHSWMLYPYFIREAHRVISHTPEYLQNLSPGKISRL
ncbi:hypothetical protein IEQ34_001456 [Dendrobium chrysotoxum]|uniref:Uncharacterized protein n=1 Tax=Dendrobium chrysotoxum TaxID=161865 RepID=A0AAV7HQM6_DENCH|nr:hypothetical protein IEQ34_001456 [Dendrobium chrysotoxum]